MDSPVQRILNVLLALPPIEGALVVTRRGKVLAACVPGGTDVKSLARECRNVLSAGSEAVTPDADDIVRVDLRAERGSTIVLRAGPDAFLAVLTSTRTPESLSLELSQAAAAVGRVLASDVGGLVGAPPDVRLPAIGVR